MNVNEDHLCTVLSTFVQFIRPSLSLGQPAFSSTFQNQNKDSLNRKGQTIKLVHLMSTGFILKSALHLYLFSMKGQKKTKKKNKTFFKYLNTSTKNPGKLSGLRFNFSCDVTLSCEVCFSLWLNLISPLTPTHTHTHTVSINVYTIMCLLRMA